MKRISLVSGLFIAGVALFAIGLFVILRLDPFFGLISQIIPDTQAIELVGVVVQFLGQALVVLAP